MLCSPDISVFVFFLNPQIQILKDINAYISNYFSDYYFLIIASIKVKFCKRVL